MQSCSQIVATNKQTPSFITTLDAIPVAQLSGSELLGKPVSEVLEWLFPLFDDLTQILCKRDDVATVF